jgi:hypothetical protein
MALSLSSGTHVHAIENYWLKYMRLSFRNASFNNHILITEHLRHREALVDSDLVAGQFAHINCPLPDHPQVLPSRAC